MRAIAAVPVAVAAVVDRRMMPRATASAMKMRLPVPEQLEDGESPTARCDRPHIRLYTCCRTV
jgi:hypothetical protein